MFVNKKSPFKKIILPKYLYDDKQNFNQEINLESNVLKNSEDLKNSFIKLEPEKNTEVINYNKVEENVKLEKPPEFQKVKETFLQKKPKGKEIKYVDIIIEEEKPIVEAINLTKETEKSLPENLDEESSFKFNIFSKIDKNFKKMVEPEIDNEITTNQYFNNPEKRERKIHELKSFEIKKPIESKKLKLDIDETKNSLNTKINQLKHKLNVKADYKEKHNLENDLKENLYLRKYIEKPQKKNELLSGVNLKKLNLYDLIIYLNKIDVNKLSIQDKKKIIDCINFKIIYIHNLISKNNEKKVIIAANNIVNALLKTLDNMKQKRKK